MSCLKPIDIFSDWQRSRQDKIMENSAHITRCKHCSEALDLFDVAASALNDTNNVPEGEHLAPEIVAAYIEHNLSRREKLEAECHISNCGECRSAIIDLAEVIAPARESKPFLSRAFFSHASFAAAGAVVCLLLMIGLSGPRITLNSKSSSNPSNQSLSLGMGTIEGDMAFIEVLAPSTVEDLRAVEGTWEAFIHADPEMAAKTLEIAVPKWEQKLKDDPEYHDLKKIIKRLQTRVIEEQSEAPVGGGGR